MSTLVQIESAVTELPAQDQWTLLEWLQSRLHKVPQAKAETETETVQLFRQLQAEVALTKDGASAWKKSVVASRR
jgi:hypothetical protein